MTCFDPSEEKNIPELRAIIFAIGPNPIYAAGTMIILFGEGRFSPLLQYTLI